MEKKSLIIGAMTNYDFEKVRPWVKSIEKCGFTGDKEKKISQFDEFLAGREFRGAGMEDRPLIAKAPHLFCDDSRLMSETGSDVNEIWFLKESMVERHI
jgi:hypothetical protein